MDSQTPALQGYCPVGYHVAARAIVGRQKFSSFYEGQLYYCASAEAKLKFDEDPEKFLPAFNGACAFGVSIDKELTPCPTNFKIIDGRLHLFMKNEDTDALVLWNRDEEKCLVNANTQWAVQQS